MVELYYTKVKTSEENMTIRGNPLPLLSEETTDGNLWIFVSCVEKKYSHNIYRRLSGHFVAD